jgi:hypothetical protein
MSRVVLGAHVLVLLAAVVRLVQVVGEKSLTAHSERRFMGFAAPDPGLYAPLELVGRRLRFGEAVCLCAEPARLGTGWLQVMGTYFFSRAIVLVPRNTQERNALPCRRGLITIRPGPRLVLWRSRSWR